MTTFVQRVGQQRREAWRRTRRLCCWAYILGTASGVGLVYVAPDLLAFAVGLWG